MSKLRQYVAGYKVKGDKETRFYRFALPHTEGMSNAQALAEAQKHIEDITSIDGEKVTTWRQEVRFDMWVDKPEQTTNQSDQGDQQSDAAPSTWRSKLTDQEIAQAKAEITQEIKATDGE